MAKDNNKNEAEKTEKLDKTDKDKEKEKKQNEKNAKLAELAKKPKRSPLKWFKEARAEFKKVTWPTPKQVVKNTSVVLTMLAIAGISVWGLDKLLDFLFGLIIKSR
ncbi:MAG: preprotein translocase subunit SecE [Oscillospiraceae bacterium]|nr:preprotein translocase subunit SecE [Oscillospiraceae bacterium]